jgi:lactonase
MASLLIAQSAVARAEEGAVERGRVPFQPQCSACQQIPRALAYDVASRTPVPIPPSEVGLQTVTAEPWLELTDQKLFLEGVVFDRAGDLLFVDMFSGRVLKVAPDKAITTIVDKNAIAPTGLAVHKDGRLFLAGVGNMSSGSVVAFEPDGAGRADIVPPSAGYLPDDLVFDTAGGFYFADLRGTSTQPAGGVYYASSDGRISPILPNLAAANGVALSPDGKTLWVTEYARNVLHRVTLAGATTVAPLGTAIAYHFTGPSPDGLRVDADGNVYAAMFHQGRVLVFNRNGLPIGQILIPGRDDGRFLLTTSMAFKPGTNEIYLVATDGDGTHGATVFRTTGFAKAATLFSHQ